MPQFSNLLHLCQGEDTTFIDRYNAEFTLSTVEDAVCITQVSRSFYPTYYLFRLVPDNPVERGSNFASNSLFDPDNSRHFQENVVTSRVRKVSISSSTVTCRERKGIYNKMNQDLPYMLPEMTRSCLEEDIQEFTI